MFIRIIPLILSAILLGAHFLRDGNILLVLVCLFYPLLFLVKKPWSLQAVKIITYCGALTWLLTAVGIAHFRMSMGLPWMRMALILGGVAGFSVFAARLLDSPKIKERYKSRNHWS